MIASAMIRCARDLRLGPSFERPVPLVNGGSLRLRWVRPTDAALLREVRSEQFASFQTDAPSCDNCGAITVRNGNCYLCHNCGNSMGCS